MRELEKFPLEALSWELWKLERQRLVPDSVLKQAEAECGQLPDSRAEGEAHSVYELCSRNARKRACICCPDVNNDTGCWRPLCWKEFWSYGSLVDWHEPSGYSLLWSRLPQIQSWSRIVHSQLEKATPIIANWNQRISLRGSLWNSCSTNTLLVFLCAP